jgi:hypothetical protein
MRLTVVFEGNIVQYFHPDKTGEELITMFTTPFNSRYTSWNDFVGKAYYYLGHIGGEVYMNGKLLTPNQSEHYEKGTMLGTDHVIVDGEIKRFNDLLTSEYTAYIVDDGV